MGGLRIERLSGSPDWSCHWAMTLNPVPFSGLSMKSKGIMNDHPYQTQFEEFFAALRAGKEMAHTSLSEAAKSHEIIFAADQSAATGKPVKIRKG